MECAQDRLLTVTSVLRLATWNVNSLRVRLPTLLAWSARCQADVLALQETKVRDELFPREDLEMAGYAHGHWRGERAYNGVAILSRLPTVGPGEDRLSGADPDEARFLASSLSTGIRLVCVYVPNGRDPESPHFHRKLRWLEALRAWLATELLRHPRLVLLGDFNLAPEDRDVAQPERWKGSVLTHPRLRESWQALLELGLHDAYRLIHPQGEDYTWWDYRRGSFERNDGLRIDHILLSTPLVDGIVDLRIADDLRAEARPSDHAPVVLDLRVD